MESATILTAPSTDLSGMNQIFLKDQNMKKISTLYRCTERSYTYSTRKERQLSRPLNNLQKGSSLFLEYDICVVALRPKSTVMVMAGRSVHLTTLFFLGKLEQAVNQYFVHILSLVTG